MDRRNSTIMQDLESAEWETENVETVEENETVEEHETVEEELKADLKMAMLEIAASQQFMVHKEAHVEELKGDGEQNVNQEEENENAPVTEVSGDA